MIKKEWNVNVVPVPVNKASAPPCTEAIQDFFFHLSILMTGKTLGFLMVQIPLITPHDHPQFTFHSFLVTPYFPL